MATIPKQVDNTTPSGSIILFPSHRIAYALPDCFNEDERKLFYEENFRDEIPNVAMHMLEKVALINGLLIQKKNILLAFTHHRDNIPVSTFKSLIRLKLLPKEQMAEAISGIMDWADNYFHWMTELLPRIAAMHRYKSKIPLLITEKVSQLPFVRESLKLINIPYKVLPIGRGLLVENLYVCKVPHVGQFNQFLLSAFRSEVIGTLSTDRFIAPIRKLYISRSNARRRKVINEDELWHALQMHGFEKVELEMLAWKDQVMLFREAVLVVSNHGAGLSNIMFMPADSKVIELKSIQNDYWCYYSLASVCNIQYAYLLCKPSEMNHRNADISVDVNDLLRLMNIEEVIE